MAFAELTGVLRLPRFRLAWASAAASTAATSLAPVTLTLFLLDSGAGLAGLGWVLGGRTAGIVLGAVLGGVVTDGYPRRTVLALASTVRGLAMLTAAALFAVSLPAVGVAVLIAGIGEGVYRGAYQALIGEVVPKPDLQRANALSTLSGRLFIVGGPALATLLYATAGGTVTLVITGLLWLGSATVALLLPRGELPPSNEARRRPFADYAEVWREARRHRWFLAGLGALVIWLALGFASQQLLLPVISREQLGGDAFIGMALGCYSVGAIIAAVIMAGWIPRRPGVVAFVGLAAYGLVPPALLVVPEQPAVGVVVVLLAYLLGGAGIEAFNIAWFSAIQREVPAERMGRMFSFDFMVSYGIAPLGLILLPVAITTIGSPIVLVVCGILTLSSALAVLAVPGADRLADPRRRPGSALDPTQEGSRS